MIPHVSKSKASAKMTIANKYSVAPATGTPETGGWSTRELRTIIRGLEGINIVAADVVEVAPAYDTNAVCNKTPDD